MTNYICSHCKKRVRLLRKKMGDPEWLCDKCFNEENNIEEEVDNEAESAKLE